jgi:hypothetical protein
MTFSIIVNALHILDPQTGFWKPLAPIENTLNTLGLTEGHAEAPHTRLQSLYKEGEL